MKPGTQGTPGVREEPTIPVMTGSGRSKAARPPEAQGEIIKSWNHTFTETVETEKC